MAFLTSRIDANANDTEKHYSARSLASSVCCSNSTFNLSSRSYDNSIRSVRDVNSSAFMNNNSQFIAVSSRDNANSTNISECHSDIVPPLDLKSEDNYPTTGGYTFSYRKHCEANKAVLKPDNAFETWLSAKRKLLSDKAAIRKKEEDLKQGEIEERKRLAQEKYDMWLEKKSQSAITLQSTNNSIKTAINLEPQRRSKLSPEEVKVRVKNWEKEKGMEEARRRMLKHIEKQRHRELEDQRRQMAVEAWDNWIANASKKPKPVPLNRGIFTLRGTVSDIFINPNEWKPIIETHNEDNR